MTANITMTGDKAVDNLLKTLEPKLQKKAIAKGTRAGAKVVLQAAKSLVPRGRTLTLLKTLAVRTAKRDKGQRMSPGYQGHSVTHTARKSVTAAVEKLGLTGKKAKYAGDPYYSIWVEWGAYSSPGVRYIRKALYSSRAAVVSANQKAIAAGVVEIAAKSRAKARG